MAELQTGGYALSTLPRAPNIPANVGMVNVKEIYDGVRRGLQAFEAVRQAPASMALADTSIEADRQKALAVSQTAGPLAQQTIDQIPERNKLLVAQAKSAEQTAAKQAEEIALTQKLREQRERDLAADETGESAYDRALREAHSLKTAAERAAAFSGLSARFPWFQLPEEKGSRGQAAFESQKANERLTEREAVIEGQKTVAEINRQRAESAARLRADATVRAADLRAKHGDEALLQRLSQINAALDADPANEVLLADKDAVQQILNKRSATAPVDPNRPKSPAITREDAMQDRLDRATKLAAQAKIDLDAAITSGDPEVIADAQEAFAEADRRRKIAEGFVKKATTVKSDVAAEAAALAAAIRDRGPKKPVVATGTVQPVSSTPAPQGEWTELKIGDQTVRVRVKP